ncbi:flocculation protein FLO11 [Plutella xylostella]|uniref:flocculation protein FLO11 n=1 Tax=Plutella xylostella TaxID=51655 RepID=UPI0020331AE2|nr:flocculation protein FLO11 [Plutella xylostella]
MRGECEGRGGAGEGRAGAGEGRAGVGEGRAGWAALVSWLRRAASSDSVSSGASDRTAASFAYLPGGAWPAPAPRAPPSPPPDAYRRRVQDLRRGYERHLTLHRKYLLPLGEARYASTVPARAGRGGRGDTLRRAHVPGKRPAPPPPGRAAKRPAPQPPTPRAAPTESATLPAPRNQQRENTMNSSDRDTPANKPSILGEQNNNKTSHVKPERPKSEVITKIRQDKSFLRQIFESKSKRNSSLDVPPVKLLPNISELDKQAAELLKSYKLKACENNSGSARSSGDGAMAHKNSGETWFCTRCLKKYDATMVTCLECLAGAGLPRPGRAVKHEDTQTNGVNQPSRNGTSNNNTMEDKELLKEMLKEMKHSLPKRSNTVINGLGKKKANQYEDIYISKEAPTLPMGSTVDPIYKIEPSSSKQTVNNLPENKVNSVRNSPVIKENLRPKESVVITQTTVIVDNSNKENEKRLEATRKNTATPGKASLETEKPTTGTNSGKLSESLTISMLLNPVYVPKQSVTKDNNISNFSLKQSFLNQPSPSSATKTPASTAPSTSFTKFEATPVIIPTTSETKSTEATSKMPTVIQGESGSKEANAIPCSNVITNLDTRKVNTNNNQTKETAVTVKIIKATENKPSSPKVEIKNKDNLIKPDTKPLNVDAKTNPVAAISPSDIKPVSQAAMPSTSSTVATSSNVETGKGKAHVRLSGELSKRRDLIAQLETSIASGDERAAAEAASRLAQLRLSCSVLSFSSQIINDAVPTMAETTKTSKVTIKPTESRSNEKRDKVPPKKIDSSTQSEGTKCIKVVSAPKREIVAAVKNTTESSGVESIPNGCDKINVAPKECVKTEVAKASSATPSTSKEQNEDSEDSVIISVWVEDKWCARGPVRLQVRRGASLGSLRRAAETRLGLPAPLQRWVVGRALAARDTDTLEQLAGEKLDQPFYLCLVEPETNSKEASVSTSVPVAGPSSDTQSPSTSSQQLPATAPPPAGASVYAALVLAEQQALTPSPCAFECGVCVERVEGAAGVLLHECGHAFCRACLAAVAEHCAEAAAPCPEPGCAGALTAREERALLSAEQWERRLARSLAAAESSAPHSFHCRTRDCAGWALCEPPVARFHCPVCQRVNCLPCQAVHEGETCSEHRARLQRAAAAAAGAADAGTRALLADLTARGEALACPQCGAVITKKWGCDWVRCAACKTEICWVTRGRRWGPGGKGDTSAGCRCGVDGRRCHPSCGYCH